MAVSIPSAAIDPLIVPDYIRFPVPGQRDPRTNLSRSALDLLTRPQEANGFKPPVASKLFNQAGNQRPIRMIDYRSLLAYLNSLPDGADPANTISRGRYAKTGNP